MFHIAVFDIIIIFMYLSNFGILHQEKAKPTIKIHCAFFSPKKPSAFFASKVEQESKCIKAKTNLCCPSAFDRVFTAK